MAVSSNGTVFLANGDDGLRVYSFDGSSFTQFHGYEGFKLSVFDLIEDRNRNIWMGTPYGAFKMDSEKISRYDASSGLTGKWFWCVQEDSKGNIWLGGPGANKISGNQVTQYTVQTGLSDGVLRCASDCSSIDSSHCSECGNATREGDEVCDDGNAVGDDGCSADCTERSRNYICATPGEPCTRVVICGDGRIGGDETCEDGNLDNFDVDFGLNAVAVNQTLDALAQFNGPVRTVIKP